MSPDEAVIHVNRDAPGSIAGPGAGLEVRGSFDLRLSNHGDPAHVHCRLDGDLAAVASTVQANYFVGEGGETVVPIEVADVESPVSGTLEVSTRYGAEATAVEVTITPGPDPVDVDESLASPPEGEPDQSLEERVLAEMTIAGVDAGTLAVVAFAALAVLVGVVAAATVGGPTAIVGVLVVAAGVGVAVALLLR